MRPRVLGRSHISPLSKGWTQSQACDVRLSFRHPANGGNAGGVTTTFHSQSWGGAWSHFAPHVSKWPCSSNRSLLTMSPPVHTSLIKAAAT